MTIPFSILIEFDKFTHQLIAFEKLFLTSTRSNSIRPIIEPEVHKKRDGARVN